jgi:hypothetical protein
VPGDRSVQQQCIPERIIQTGKTRDLHFKEKVSAINLQVLNPHFEYLFFYDRQVELFIDSTFRDYR